MSLEGFVLPAVLQRIVDEMTPEMWAAMGRMWDEADETIIHAEVCEADLGWLTGRPPRRFRGCHRRTS